MKKSLLALLCLCFAIASCAQNVDVSLFAKPDLSSLKKNVSLKDISKIDDPVLQEVATQLYNKNYPLKDRMRSYECYLSPRVLAQQLKTSSYSQFENPTGIHFDAGDKAILWVGAANGAALELRVTNWDNEDFKDSKYALQEGYNVIEIKNNGNSYISYFADENVTDYKIKIHI